MRKRTLRRLTPQARELAKLYNELQSINRRLKTIIGKVVEIEATGKTEKEWFEETE